MKEYTKVRQFYAWFGFICLIGFAFALLSYNLDMWTWTQYRISTGEKFLVIYSLYQ